MHIFLHLNLKTAQGFVLAKDSQQLRLLPLEYFYFIAFRENKYLSQELAFL